MQEKVQEGTLKRTWHEICHYKKLKSSDVWHPFYMQKNENLTLVKSTYFMHYPRRKKYNLIWKHQVWVLAVRKRFESKKCCCFELRSAIIIKKFWNKNTTFWNSVNYNADLKLLIISSEFYTILKRDANGHVSWFKTKILSVKNVLI